MPVPTLIVPLSAVDRGDHALVGGKAASLGELLRAGLPVPDGFCIPCPAYRAHLEANGLGERIHARLAGGALSDPGRAAAADIRSWIAGSAVAPEIAREVRAAVEALGNGPVAVRSSATAEDLPGASFAGQHDTYLDVVGPEAVIERVRSCWASLWTERALLYRVQNGFDVEDVAIACLVQRMVPATAAGVAFTADPVSGERDRIVVNAVAGLGESLVSGRATADQYVLRKSDAALLERRLARAGAAEPAPGFLPDLVALVVRVEHHFGVPQDIEWAFADGKVFLLQARPITNLKPEPVAFAEAERPILFYAERVREMIPSALTPLTGDIALGVILPLIEESLVHHGFAPASVATQVPSFSRLVRGRLYIAADALRENFLPGLDELSISDLLEGGKHPPLRALRPSVVLALAARLPFVLVQLVRSMRQLDRLTRETEGTLDRLFSPLEREDVRSWDWPRLLGLLRVHVSDSFRRDLIAVPPANALARGAGTPFYAALVAMATRWAGEPPEAAGRLVSGLTGLVEVECAATLWDLAERARALPAVAAALEADPERALEALAAVPEARDWRAAFEAFLARFGHRGIEEVELARPRWRERPAYPLSVIANYMHCPPEASPRAVEERRRREREAIEARVFRRLRFRPLRRFLFGVALEIAQKSTAASENTKFHIVRLLTLQRTAALEMGRRLVEQGRLERPDDVFFLELAELERPQDGDLEARVASRRADYAGWQREHPPRVIDARGRPVREGMRAPSPSGADVLTGIGSSAGVARGRVRIVRDPSRGIRLLPGEILVAPYTDPAWTPLFVSAGAVVVETGSLLSHASIVARELGIPSVVAVPGATEVLSEGGEVEVDGTHGRVRRL